MPRVDGSRVVVPGAEVRSKSDGGDEEEDSNRDSNAVAKPANVAAAEEATTITAGGVVHDVLLEEQAKTGSVGD